MSERSGLKARVFAAALILSSVGSVLARPSNAEASEGNQDMPSTWLNLNSQSGAIRIPGTRFLEVFYKCNHWSSVPIVDVNPARYAGAYSTNPASGDAIAARYPYDAPPVAGRVPPHAIRVNLSGIAYSPDFSMIHADALQLPPSNRGQYPPHVLESIDTSFNCRTTPYQPPSMSQGGKY